uniref:Uncharacterized protein n=1 Tax=Timema tahoe TaxID=61484 RepID=A0A7R9IDX3_9NEOP|nr:unnamed protein product [Timema tahoe]
MFPPYWDSLQAVVEDQPSSLLCVTSLPRLNSWDPTMVMVDMLKHHSSLGDVQTSACVLLVMGDRRRTLTTLDEAVQEHWLLAYIDILFRLQLWDVTTKVIQLAWIPMVCQLNQQSTTVYTGCSRCNKPLLRSGWICDRCHTSECAACSVCHKVVRGIDGEQNIERGKQGDHVENGRGKVHGISFPGFSAWPDMMSLDAVSLSWQMVPEYTRINSGSVVAFSRERLCSARQGMRMELWSKCGCLTKVGRSRVWLGPKVEKWVFWKCLERGGSARKKINKHITRTGVYSPKIKIAVQCGAVQQRPPIRSFDSLLLGNLRGLGSLLRRILLLG